MHRSLHTEERKRSRSNFSRNAFYQIPLLRGSNTPLNEESCSEWLTVSYTSSLTVQHRSNNDDALLGSTLYLLTVLLRELSGNSLWQVVGAGGKLNSGTTVCVRHTWNRYRPIDDPCGSIRLLSYAVAEGTERMTAYIYSSVSICLHPYHPPLHSTAPSSSNGFSTSAKSVALEVSG